jgi:hypothetical protein
VKRTSWSYCAELRDKPLGEWEDYGDYDTLQEAMAACDEHAAREEVQQ